MAILQTYSPSPYRIKITTTGAPDLVAGDYAITRVDGASSAAAVTLAFQSPDGPNTAELVVNPPLIDGVVYQVSVGGFMAQVAYRVPAYASQVPVYPAEDPEAEAFGVDVDWFADALAGNGDTPSVRGVACLKNDLAVIALVTQGELFHRPDAGAGLKLFTNGPMNARSAADAAGALAREWYRDGRVRPGGVTVVPSVSANTGQLLISATVLPVAVDDPLTVKLPGGGS